MSLGPSSYTASTATVDAVSYNTTAINPVANGLIIATIGNSAGSSALPVLSGNSLTWTQVVTRVSSSLAQRLTIFKAIIPSSGSTSGAITISFGGAVQTSCQWSILHITDSDFVPGSTWGDPIVQTGSAASVASGLSGSWSFTNPISDPVNNIVIAGWRHAAFEGTTRKPLWSEIHDLQSNSPNTGFETQWNAGVPSDNSPGASWSTSSEWIGVGAEIRPAIPPAPTANPAASQFLAVL